MLFTSLYSITIEVSGSGNDEIGGHAEVIVGGEPVVGRELVVRQTQDLIETTQILGALAGEDVHSVGADDVDRSLVDAIAREDPLSWNDHVGSSVFLDPVDVHVHFCGQGDMRVADDEVGDHAEIIVGGEPVIGGELISRVTHDFIESIPKLGALAGEDIHAIGADHTQRTAIHGIAGEDALSGSDGVGGSVLLDTCDIDIHFRREGGMRIADDEIGDHAGIVVGGEPVIGGELVARVTHDFIETLSKLGALAGEDVDAIGADDVHGSGVDAVAGEDALSGSDHIGRGVALDASDVDIHFGGEARMRIADDEIGDHAEVIVGSEPVVGGELIGGIAHDGIEAAPEDGALAGKDRQVVRAGHLHRSTIDPVAIKDAFFRRNSVVSHIVPTDQDINICAIGGRLKCGCVVLGGLIGCHIAIASAGGSESETGV